MFNQPLFGIPEESPKALGSNGGEAASIAELRRDLFRSSASTSMDGSSARAKGFIRSGSSTASTTADNLAARRGSATLGQGGGGSIHKGLSSLEQQQQQQRDRQQMLIKKASTVSSMSTCSGDYGGAAAAGAVGEGGGGGGGGGGGSGSPRSHHHGGSGRRICGGGSLPPHAELYINQLKQLLREAKEELKKRHKTIEMQKKRLENAEEGRLKSKAIFHEMIERIRCEVELQEILQLQLDDLQARNDQLEAQMGELRWERADEDMFLTSRELKEELDEKSVKREEATTLYQQTQQQAQALEAQVKELTERIKTLSQAREEEEKSFSIRLEKEMEHAEQLEEQLKARELKLEEAAAHYQQSEEKHKAALEELQATDQAIIHDLEGQVKALNDQVKQLVDQVTQLSTSRDEEVHQRVKIQSHAEGISRSIQQAVSNVQQKREMFIARLKEGIPVLKHGRQGRPHLRVLGIDDKCEYIRCRDKDNPKHDKILPVDGLQVVTGKMTYVLQRATSAPKEACFSLILLSKTPTNGSLGGGNSNALSPPPPALSKTTSQRSSLRNLLNAAGVVKDQGGEERESLDLEVVDGSQKKRDELVEGLRYLCLGPAGSEADSLTPPLRLSPALSMFAMEKEGRAPPPFT